jgi:hypothetical protein
MGTWITCPTCGCCEAFVGHPTDTVPVTTGAHISRSGRCEDPQIEGLCGVIRVGCTRDTDTGELVAHVDMYWGIEEPGRGHIFNRYGEQLCTHPPDQPDEPSVPPVVCWADVG